MYTYPDGSMVLLIFYLTHPPYSFVIVMALGFQLRRVPFLFSLTPSLIAANSYGSRVSVKEGGFSMQRLFLILA